MVATTGKKPRYKAEYVAWLKETLDVTLYSRLERYYQSVTADMKSNLEKSAFWQALPASLRVAEADYRRAHDLPLLSGPAVSPTVHIKPFESLLEKSYRKNVLNNGNWPDPPPGGWILPDNWLENLNDILRTTVVVKYFDGVTFLISKLTQLANEQGLDSSSSLEAHMEEGYYAAHFIARQSVEIPKIDWDTQRISAAVEIQVTTQLQEVLRSLLHTYYETTRMQPKIEEKSRWQWDHTSEEFSVNYLGHLLHYVEGMIVTVRDKQKGAHRD